MSRVRLSYPPVAIEAKQDTGNASLASLDTKIIVCDTGAVVLASGTLTGITNTVAVSGPLTDAQLRASAVPVSGPLTDAQLRASAVVVSATNLDIRDLTASADAVSIHGDVGILDQLDLTNANPATVAIVDGSGNQITSFGGGTQYTEGDTDATITGTAMLVEGAADALKAITGRATGSKHPMEVAILDASGNQVTSFGGAAPNRTAISLGVSESVAAPTAATWYLKRQWAPPSGGFFRPSRAWSVVTTAGSRSMVAVGKRLGSFNVSTNAFTDDQSVASPHHFGRLFAIVITAMSAVANTVTVTYTNEEGTTGRTTVALSIPASAPVGNAFEFQLAATTGQMRDEGVRDVTAVSDSAAPTGVIEIWGVNCLHDAQGAANAFEVSDCDDATITSSETVFLLMQQAATTAQQRGVFVSGTIDTA